MDDNVKLGRIVALAIFALSFPLVASAADGRRGTSDADRRNRPDRYWAMFRDGSVMIGKDLRDWHERGKSPSLNGKPLFNASNPLRLLRDTTLQYELSGPYFEFANGDILPGRAVGGIPADPATRMPAHLLVAVAAPLLGIDRRGNEVAVDPRHISRVILNKEARGPLEPGTLHFNDGRKVKVKAIKWALGGVKALTEEGSLAAGWLELSEIHPPGVDPIAALLDDALAPTPQKVEGLDAMLGRIATSGGAVLTYRRAMLRSDGERDEKGQPMHTVQPAWALSAIRVPFDEVVTRSYREPADIPLSSLPGSTVLQKSATGFTWHWRRNANVRGAELVLGSAVGDVGVGTHSYSEIAFDMPPGAKQFKAIVGINRAVGNGGCAKVKVFVEKVGDKPIFESGYLRGGDTPLTVGPVAIEGAKKLILVTDFGHEGRPRGADPLDIRDEVDWLWPSVTVDLAAAAKGRPQPALEDVFPSLEGWTVAKDLRDRATLRPFWNPRAGRWQSAMYVNAEQAAIEQIKPFEVTRRMTVTQANAWLEVTASRDEQQGGHMVSVHVDDKPVESVHNADVNTQAKPVGEYDERYYSLGPWAGKEVNVSVRVKLHPPGQKQAGLVWGRMTPSPIVSNLPEGGSTLKPEVSITKLKPTAAQYRKDNKMELQPGKTIDGKPLALNRWVFTDGYGMPLGESALTYSLDPAWKRFVAVIGMGEGWQGSGPYEVWLDDKVFWKSVDPATFSRTTELYQVDVEIPAGHKTITLRLDKKNQTGSAWADAGFMAK